MFYGFYDFKDLSIFHHRKIPFLLFETSGEANCVGPKKQFKIIQNDSTVFQTSVILIMIYVFGFSAIIQDLLRSHHRRFRLFWKRSEKPIVLNPREFKKNSLKYDFKNVMSDSFQHFDIFGFLKC